MKLTFFANQNDFRKWLEENHQSEIELLVGFYKVASRKPSMTWSESVDQALCFGWIDGVRKSIDEISYSIRFTPRKSRSIWSAVNIKKVAELTKKELMQTAGIVAFSKRSENKSKIYAYENTAKELDKSLEQNFKANLKAWIFFNEQPQSYKKTILYWIMSGKKEETRIARLEKVINQSEIQKRLT